MTITHIYGQPYASLSDLCAWFQPIRLGALVRRVGSAAAGCGSASLNRCIGSICWCHHRKCDQRAERLRATLHRLPFDRAKWLWASSWRCLRQTRRLSGRIPIQPGAAAKAVHLVDKAARFLAVGTSPIRAGDADEHLDRRCANPRRYYRLSSIASVRTGRMSAMPS